MKISTSIEKIRLEKNFTHEFRYELKIKDN